MERLTEHFPTLQMGYYLMGPGDSRTARVILPPGTFFLEAVIQKATETFYQAPLVRVMLSVFARRQIGRELQLRQLKTPSVMPPHPWKYPLPHGTVLHFEIDPHLDFPDHGPPTP